MSLNVRTSPDDPDDPVGLLLGLYDQSFQSADDAALNARMARMRQGLFLLVDDGDELEPPPRLAEKTLARIHKKNNASGPLS